MDKKEKSSVMSVEDLDRLSVYEEDMLWRRLRDQLAAAAAASGGVQKKHRPDYRVSALYRKLCVRKRLRRTTAGRKAIFDFDAEARKLWRQKHQPEATPTDSGSATPTASSAKPSSSSSSSSSGVLLDRFHLRPAASSSSSSSSASSCLPAQHAEFIYLVPASAHVGVISSPYTGRKLKPFIRREFELEPLKLKLHKELRQKVLERKKGLGGDVDMSTPLAPAPAPAPAHSIDFCYVQPHHISAINKMATDFFWPDIDVSESLQFPDFSCVALYGRIVVGFAFLIPDMTHTEAYLSFIFTHPDWRRGGIAKFMLYHLIQSCGGKDITLHVSANNPAVMLYQNFGFKVEERILDFYDKYLSVDSKECKHALFLRLTR